MPDRVIRGSILSSKKVNTLNWAAEVFYRRLMSVVDDFGRYEFDSQLLRSLLYPLKVDRVSVSDIDKWSADCAEAGLVRLYTVENKDYIELLEFNQRLRIQKSKFPAPTDAVKCQRMSAECGQMSPETKRNETETKMKEKENSSPPPPSKIDAHDEFRERMFPRSGYLSPNPASVAIRTNEENAADAVQDPMFLERAIRMGLKNEIQVAKSMNDFISMRNASAKLDTNTSEFRTHFFNWLPKQIDRMMKQPTAQQAQAQDEMSRKHLEYLKSLRNGRNQQQNQTQAGDSQH